MAHRSNLICSAVIVACAIAAPARADNHKRAAQALVTEGVALLQHKKYDAALDKFRDAYTIFQSPKILLDIGSTLREMGKVADAANTYATYLDDPGADSRRKPEVKKILRDLDKRLTVMMVDVTPIGAELAVDDGPWIPVAGRMQTRVDPGTHLVRVRHVGLAQQELRVDGHPGEHQDLSISLRAPEAAPPPVAIAPPPPPAPAPVPTPAPIVTVRANRTPPSHEVAFEPLAPPPATADDETIEAYAPPPMRPGAVGLQADARIDGRLRGGAAAFGVIFDGNRIETEISALVSHDAERVVPGAYAGVRVHAGTRLRPFLGAGAPVIWSGDEPRVAIRGSAGLQLFLDSHVAFLVDLGVEHFFNPQPTYEATLFVPIVGLQGRL